MYQLLIPKRHINKKRREKSLRKNHIIPTECLYTPFHQGWHSQVFPLRYVQYKLRPGLHPTGSVYRPLPAADGLSAPGYWQVPVFLSSVQTVR